MHREPSGIVGASPSVNAQGDQRDCTVSGDEPGVQRDQVVLMYVCVCEGCRRPRGLAAGSCTSQHTCCAHWTKSRDGDFWRPTAAPCGAAGEVQLDSAYCTTAVACRRCSCRHGGGVAS